MQNNQEEMVVALCRRYMAHMDRADDLGDPYDKGFCDGLEYALDLLELATPTSNGLVPKKQAT